MATPHVAGLAGLLLAVDGERTWKELKDAIMDTVDIDIVLTDLMMPGIDGLELMKLVRDRSRRIPVVMITGYATVNTALQATQLGAFDYVAKPFSKKELLGVVHRAVALVQAYETGGPDRKPNGDAATTVAPRTFKALGDQSWLMLEEDGSVLLGVERSFLHTVGKIQTVFLPEEGDELRQGSVYFKIFSSDMRAHTVLSPLSGVVVRVNREVTDDAETALADPYGGGWLIRLKPSKFEQEVKLLGL